MDSAPDSKGLPRPPRRIAGKYDVLEVIGRGGRGVVYRALQIDLNRDVALKTLRDVDDDARARFLREARIAAEVRHPCVAEIYDAGVDEDGTPYYAMELLEGDTLASRIDKSGPIPAEEAVAIAAQVCSALGVIHKRGLVHRDIKPSNIFLARRLDGGTDPKLIDFGIAKRVAVEPEVLRRITLRGNGPSANTAAHLVVGTPVYMAPEQVLGEGIDARVDVYALAVSLYEALSGAPPFDAPEIPDLLSKIVVEEPAKLAGRVPGVNAELDREILRALAKDPNQRPASAADFASALWAALAAKRHSPAPAPLPPIEDTPPLPLSNPLRWILPLAAALVLVIAVVGFRHLKAEAAPQPPPTAAATAVSAATSPPIVTPAATSLPESAPPPVDSSARPAPKAKGARPQPRADRAPSASSASAPTSYRLDDLKVPY